MSHQKSIYISILNEGTIRCELATLLMRWQQTSPYKLFFTFPADKPIENNRNKIWKDFMKSGYDYLLQIDDDIIPPENYLDLVIHDKDIISGVCFAFRQDALVPLILKNEPDHYVFNDEEDLGKEVIKQFNTKKVSRNVGLIEVDAVGTGALFTHRRVFENERMQKHPFITLWNEDGTRKIGQDLGFCRKAQENGFKIWLDTRYECEHVVEAMGLKRLWHTMRDMAVEAGSLNDDFNMRRLDGKKPLTLKNFYVVSPEQREEINKDEVSLSKVIENKTNDL